jgi:hypothetical protein
LTDKHTLSIDQAEWRVLFASNVQRVQEFINQTQVLTPENLIPLLDHLERAKLLASAWQKASPAVTEAKAADVPAETNHQSNGVSAPKKRRGRPSNAELAGRAQVQ